MGVSPWSHGGGRWAGASLPPRAWQPRPPPVGRDGWIAGVNVSDGSCTRLRSGTSCERSAGTAGGPGTRGSPAERGIHEFYRLPKFARGDGVSRKRAVGGTHRSVDAESDAGLLLGLGGELPAVEKAGNVGSEVSSRRSDRTGQRLERPIGISLPLALEKNRASTSSCVAEQAPGGTRDDAPGDRSAGSEGRGGTGEGGHDCLLGGYRNVRCRVLKTSARSAMLGLLLPRQTARSSSGNALIGGYGCEIHRPIKTEHLGSLQVRRVKRSRLGGRTQERGFTFARITFLLERAASQRGNLQEDLVFPRRAEGSGR